MCVFLFSREKIWKVSKALKGFGVGNLTLTDLMRQDSAGSVPTDDLLGALVSQKRKQHTDRAVTDTGHSCVEARPDATQPLIRHPSHMLPMKTS